VRRRDYHHAARRRGGGVAALCGAAQQAAGGMPVIGFLQAGFPRGLFAFPVCISNRSLGEFGYVEARALKIEYRLGRGPQYDRLPALAAIWLIVR